MTLNAQYARIFGDADTYVSLAPKGTSLTSAIPSTAANPAVPGTPFVDVGWLAEDGIQLNTDKDVKDIHGLQGGGLVRRKVGKVLKKFTIIAIEDNYLVRTIMNAGNAYVAAGTGMAKASIIDKQNATVEMAAILHLTDGDQWDRYVLSAVDLLFMGEVTLAKNDDVRAVKIEGTIIAGSIADNYTNSAGVLAGVAA